MSDDPSHRGPARVDAATAGAMLVQAATSKSGGMPLDEVFRALAEDADSKSFRNISNRIADELHRGADMQSALRAVEPDLPAYLRRALQASNDAVHTAAILAGLTRHEVTRQRLLRKIRTVLLYPTIVIGLLAVIVTGLTLVVVPQFETIYTDFGIPLPDLTRFLMNAVGTVPWLLAGIVISAVAFGALTFVPGGARFVHWLRTAVPFVGRLWVFSAQHEFASILAALAQERVPLDEALACTAASLRDQNLARSVRIVGAKCEAGALLSQGLAESMHFDPAFPALAASGEADGTLAESLRQAAATFEEDLELQTAFLERILPSVLFIGVLTTMFFFVMGLMIPMIDLINSLGWAPAPTSGPGPLSLTLDGAVASSLVLITLGICLRMSLRLLYGARGPAADDSVYLFMRILGAGLVLMPMIVMSIAGANWLSLVLLAAIAEALVELLVVRRAAQRQAVWRLLVGAVASGRSVVDALRFHQRRFSGVVGRWQRLLVHDLAHGVPWPTALWINRRAVPREAPALAGMATSDRTIAEVSELADRRDPVARQMEQYAGQRFVYLATIATLMAGVLMFVMDKIVPSFQAIFEDFDMTLPPLTLSVISFSNSVSHTLALPLVILGFLLFGGALIVGILYLCDIHALETLADRFTSSRHRARIMQLLAAGFRQSLPIDDSLERLTTRPMAYPSKLHRRRLAHARERIARGEEWQDALWQSSLISAADVAVLRSAQTAGNLPWALQLLSERKIRRAAFRLNLMQQAAFVAVVIVFGLFVLWFAAAMLVPLADLIISLSD